MPRPLYWARQHRASLLKISLYFFQDFVDQIIGDFGHGVIPLLLQ